MMYNTSVNHDKETQRLLEYKGYTKADTKNSFTLCGKVSFGFTLGLALFCVGVVVGQLGQSVTLPLFLSTFVAGDVPGLPAYFVIWFCSLCFTIVFGISAMVLNARGGVTQEMKQWKWHKYMALVGIFDSLNGILIVYSSFLSRVPGPTGAILQNSSLIYTIVFSKLLLNKHYNLRQIFGVFLVAGGIIVTLIPTILVIIKGEQGSAAAWWWPLVAVVGYIPGTLMNIVMEKMQDKFRTEAKEDKRYSVLYFQAVESFYQWTCMSLLFWTDLIPGFGISGDISTFWEVFTFDWRCFLGIGSAVEVCSRCNYSGAIGVIFIGSYLTSYIFGTEMTLYASANLSSVVSTLPPILTVLFWYSFPTVNAWGGGSPFTHSDLFYNFGALPCLLIGLFIFRYYEVEDKRPEEDEIAFGGVELCC